MISCENQIHNCFKSAKEDTFPEFEKVWGHHTDELDMINALSAVDIVFIIIVIFTRYSVFMVCSRSIRFFIISLIYDDSFIFLIGLFNRFFVKKGSSHKICIRSIQ